VRKNTHSIPVSIRIEYMCHPQIKNHLTHRIYPTFLRRSDPAPALSDCRPCSDRGSPRAATVLTMPRSHRLASTAPGQIFFSPPPFRISPTECSTAPGATCRRASPSRHPRAPEDRRCVEHLLEPPSSERSPEVAGHFFTIRHRERLLVAGLLRPYPDPAIASRSFARPPWCSPTPPGSLLTTGRPPHRCSL
jgi:hypothetical protein